MNYLEGDYGKETEKLSRFNVYLHFYSNEPPRVPIFVKIYCFIDGPTLARKYFMKITIFSKINFLEVD